MFEKAPASGKGPVADEPSKPEAIEVTEINIAEDSSFVSFDDTKIEAEAPVIPKEAYEKSAPSVQNLDPDITSDGNLVFPNEEPDNSKDLKREQKRKLREEKAAQKEAKRKEKLDKKKKVRRTDFQPGSDIDIFPEDDE